MLDIVARTLDRYRMLEGVRRLGVAVSGGSDSVCLLHVLREIAATGIEFAVIHLDHNLRPDSADDARFVGEVAASLNLPLSTRTLNLPAAGNLEQEARRARLAFFSELLQSGQVDRVATGHTRSDQAETVLFRLLRGAAGAGLAGIHPVTATGLIRPLIAVERRQVLDYLRTHRIPWREDSTNASAAFARNRIRHELLPQLARDWNPEIVSALAHTADWAFEEESTLTLQTEALSADHFLRERGAVVLRAATLLHMPRGVARRLVRRAIQEVKGNLRAVTFEHIETVLALAADPGGGFASLPGISVCRSFDWVRFAQPAESLDWSVALTLPSTVPLPGDNRSISLEIIDKAETSGPSQYVYNSEMGCLDGNLVSGSLTLRNWRPGDRYQPKGTPIEARLKDLFQKARVPLWDRAGWPVLEAGERIVWSRRFGAAAWCAAGPGSTIVLKVQETAC